MNTIHAINQELVKRHSLVAVFAGGSGGIGALSLKALAATVGKVEGKGLRAYIIGRNASAAQEVIAECQKDSTTSLASTTMHLSTMSMPLATSFSKRKPGTLLSQMSLLELTT
jgi:hypothetical protein